jgi:hypothetical protein
LPASFAQVYIRQACPLQAGLRSVDAVSYVCQAKKYGEPQENGEAGEGAGSY